MERVIICPICLKRITTNQPRKKYCSASCKEAGRKITRKLWIEKEPERIRLYMREYRKRKKEATDAD